MLLDSPNSPVYVALDLGSNSFHMLVARSQGGKLEIIDRHREMVRLASGLRQDGALSKKIMSTALDALRRFAERIRSIPNAQVRIIGTNTLRVASNSDSFLERAEEILQCPIDIISGIEEARLIYLGVANDFSPDGNSRLVIDIGGGSTELILGDVKPKYMESLYMGCVSYTQQFFRDGDISSNAYRQAKLAAQAEVQSYRKRFSKAAWGEAVGASGTIRSIENILDGLGLTKDHIISHSGLKQLAETMCKVKNISELSLPNLAAERAPVLPGGLAVLDGLFEELGICEMHVSKFAIREGVVLDLAGLRSNRDVRRDTVILMQQQYRVDVEQAERVKKFADFLMDQVKDEFGEDFIKIKRLLCWAIDLHEIGLSISHGGYHKHSAYLLENSDMPGFSKQEQKMLSFLAMNHRRKLRPMAQTYGFDPDWRVVQIFRLAWIFNRARDDSQPDDFKLKIKAEHTKISLAAGWLVANPLTSEALFAEQSYLEAQGNLLEIVPVEK